MKTLLKLVAFIIAVIVFLIYSTWTDTPELLTVRELNALSPDKKTRTLRKLSFRDYGAYIGAMIRYEATDDSSREAMNRYYNMKIKDLIQEQRLYDSMHESEFEKQLRLQNK